MTDITEHKWSDTGYIIQLTRIAEDNIWLDVDRGVLEINKSDAIAIAKHFGLLEPDSWLYKDRGQGVVDGLKGLNYD